jgi:hypothetical protein
MLPILKRSKVIRRIQQVLPAVALLFTPLLASAQVVTIDLSAERDFIYQDGIYPTIGESVLPFVVTVHNPGTTTINDLEFTVLLSANTDVGNVDSQCVVSDRHGLLGSPNGREECDESTQTDDASQPGLGR